MSRWIVPILILVLTLGIIASAQDKAPAAKPAPVASTPVTVDKDLVPLSDLERLTLENAQKDAIIQQQQSAGLRLQLQTIQAQIQQADAAMGAAIKTLNDKAAEVKKSHNWGDDVTFNQAFDKDHPAFTRAPKPATPATPPAINGKDAKKPAR